jgi:hypothetical protein
MSTSTVQSRQSKDDEQLRNGKHTFVLVHGAWCGGWLWRHVAPRLKERHAVTTLTLTAALRAGTNAAIMPQAVNSTQTAMIVTASCPPTPKRKLLMA